VQFHRGRLRAGVAVAVTGAVLLVPVLQVDAVHASGRGESSASGKRARDGSHSPTKRVRASSPIEEDSSVAVPVTHSRNRTPETVARLQALRDVLREHAREFKLDLDPQTIEFDHFGEDVIGIMNELFIQPVYSFGGTPDKYVTLRGFRKAWVISVGRPIGSDPSRPQTKIRVVADGAGVIQTVTPYPSLVPPSIQDMALPQPPR
jgi:hypothetical protein